ALLGLRPLRSAGARRAEPTVHPAEDPERRPELTTDPDPGDPDRDLVATLGDRGGARRIRHGIIRSLEVDLLVPDPRRDRPAAECNVILNVERPRPRTAHTVRLAARRTPVRQPHHTADHLVPVVVLEPILLVLVVPSTELDRVPRSAHPELHAHRGLDPLRVVAPVVGSNGQRTRLAVPATHDLQRGRVRRRIPYHRRDVRSHDAGQLVPVPVELVTVRRDRDIEETLRTDEVPRLVLTVLRC